jgi:hypothetical protein
MTLMVSSRPYRGRGSNDFITQKVYFLRLKRVCVGLIMLGGVYLVRFSFFFICQQGLGHFFRYRPLLPIGWRIVQILRQRWRKTTNTKPTILKCNTSSKPINFYCYKQIKLLSQRKLAGRNM